MVIHERKCPASGCGVEIPVALDREGLCLQHYLEKAFHEVSQVTLDFQCEREIDDVRMEWLLSQVTFAVDALGLEDSPWTPEQRSTLLELVLAIANLNEYLRHRGVVTGHRS